MQTTKNREVSTVTFHKKKIYIPQTMQDELRLKDGDRLTAILEGGRIVLTPCNPDEATERLLAFFSNPPNLGELKGGLRRRDIYADRPRL